MILHVACREDAFDAGCRRHASDPPRVGRCSPSAHLDLAGEDLRVRRMPYRHEQPLGHDVALAVSLELLHADAGDARMSSSTS